MKERRTNNNTDYVYPFSLDVTSMFTSIPAQEAVDLLCHKLSSMDYHYFGLVPEDFRSLLMVVMDNSFIQFEGAYYKQIVGLPMGNKISSMLAEVYMEHVETPLVHSLAMPFYYRYVDDVLALSRTKEEADNTLITFNSANQHIRFEIEHPDEDGVLSLLDFKLCVSGQSPSIQPYNKTFKSSIFVAGDTALPSRTKRKILTNEWRRLRNRCQTTEDMVKCREIFLEKLMRNNHQDIPFLSLFDTHRTTSPHTDPHTFYLSIPFINDEVNTMIKRSLVAFNLNYNIRLTHKSPNLCQLLNPSQRKFLPPTRNGKCNINGCRINDANMCFKSMIVYEAICDSCLNNYIGSTKKFYHLRIKEHFSQSGSHIYHHNLTCAGTWSFKVRQSYNSVQSMRWGEALLIRKDKPTLNKKEGSANLQSFLT